MARAVITKTADKEDRTIHTPISGPALSQLLAGKTVKSVLLAGLDYGFFMYFTDGSEMLFIEFPKGPHVIYRPVVTSS